MNKLFKHIAAAAIALCGTALAQADDAHHQSGSASAAPVAQDPASGAPATPARQEPVSGTPAEQAKQEMASGEIRKIDRDAGKLTIRHGELKNLEMPPMTMVFQVKDKALLDRVKVGDKINFLAEKVDEKLTVVRLEPAQ